MAKTIKINEVTYQDVPYINIPLADGGGNAKYVDTDSGTATAQDMRQGTIAWVDGNEVAGNVPAKTQTDLQVSGKTVTVPAGIYDDPASASVADGSATPSADIVGTEIGDSETAYPITITPKATVGTPGYIEAISDGAAVTKYIQTETKTADPTTSSQSITPTTGKLLSAVTVNPVVLTGNATAADVMAGKTFYNTSLELVTGNATVPTVSQDPTEKFLMIV